jgi:proteasome lid subunit RPN8/RPN11
MAPGPVVEVPGAVLDAMVDQARAAAPAECCGLLVGLGRRVVRAHPARNLAASPARYLVAPEDHFAALRTARAEGLAVIGAYHSHPSSAPVPSPTDRAEAVSDFVYVIAGLAPAPAVRAWHLVGGNFVPLSLVRT